MMDSSIVGVLGTVLGVFLAGPITYYFSKVLVEQTHTNALALIERQETHKAFLALEASFVPVLRILREPEAKDRQKIPTFFDCQDIAMLSFVWHLSGEARSNFETKWSEYEDWRKTYAEYESRQENSGILLMDGNRRGPFVKLLEEILETAKKY